MAQVDLSKILIWRLGRPADIWLSHSVLVNKLIKQFKLKPLAVESYPSMPAMDASMIEETAMMSTRTKAATIMPPKLRWPRPFPGGLRIPHVHYGADVYLLNQTQWKDFSTSVLRDVSKRISSAKEISFEQVVELSEAVNTLG
jgi:hypothetical protein